LPPTQPTCDTPPLDAQGFIAAHAPCIKCNYELRGLQPFGNCPECGTPIAESANATILRCLPPAALSQLRTGLQLILGSYILFIGALIFAAVLSGVTQSWEPGCNLSLGLLLVSVLQGAGIRMTTSYHSSAGPVENSVTSLVFRIGPLVAGVSSVLLLLSFSVDSLGSSLFGVMSLLALSFGSLGVAFSDHLAKMLARHGHKHLSTLGRCLALCLVACGGLIAVGSFGLAFEIEGKARNLVEVFMMLGLLLVPVCLVGLLVLLPLVLSFVATEQRIARGWHEAMAAKFRFLSEGRAQPLEQDLS